MGNTFESDKAKKKSETEDLRNQAQISSPIMPLSGRACYVEDGKVFLNFRHYKEDYDNIHNILEKVKNQLNIITSGDALEVISKKVEDLKNLINDKSLGETIEKFLPTYTENLKNYYFSVGEMKKIYKQSSLEMQQLLTNWIKDQKNVDIKTQISQSDNYIKEMEEVKNKFNKFSEVVEILKKICGFDIKYNNNNDKINEINNYFNEHNEEIKKMYKFENPPQFRSLFNLKEQIDNNIRQKNNFLEGLINVFQQNITIYKKVLNQLNSTNLEKNEIANELNDYNNVVIYHRLIRSIEEKIKGIKIN